MVERAGTCWSVWQPGGELSPGLVSALCTAPAPAAPALVPAVTSESILQEENMNKQSNSASFCWDYSSWGLLLT